MRATCARGVVFTIFQTTTGDKGKKKSLSWIRNIKVNHVHGKTLSETGTVQKKGKSTAPVLTVHYKSKLACAGVAGVYESDGTPE